MRNFIKKYIVEILIYGFVVLLLSTVYGLNLHENSKILGTVSTALKINQIIDPITSGFLYSNGTGTSTIIASSTISVSKGGTGVSTTPTYGQILVGNSGGGYTLTATSSLGISGGGSGSPGGSSGQLQYNNGGSFAGTSSPTVGYVTGTSISTSTFAGPIQTLDLISKGPIRDVRAYGAKGNGVTDDTAAIQAALDDGGHVFIPYSAKEYIISDVLRIKSNTWLEVSASTTIYEASGNNVTMLRNQNIATTTTVDSNIKVTGGIWDMNWAGNPGTDLWGNGYIIIGSSKTSPIKGAAGTLGFYGVSGLILRDITVKNANKFSIQVAQNYDWEATNLKFIRTENTGSDGLHVNGPTSRFKIDGIYGATGDDMVALNAWDWLVSSPVQPLGGDISYGSINNIIANKAEWGIIKAELGTYAGLYNVSINNVMGTSTNGGFIWGQYVDQIDTSHTTGNGTISGVKLANVAVNVTATGSAGGDTYGSVMELSHVNIKDLTVDGVTINANNQPFSQPWLNSESSVNATSTTFSNFHVTVNPPLSYLFNLGGNYDHFTLTDSDFVGSGTYTGNSQYQLIQTGNVSHVDVSNVRLKNWAGLLNQNVGGASSFVTVSNSSFFNPKDIITSSATMNLTLTGNTTSGVSSSIVNANNASTVLDVRSAANYPFSSGGGATLVKSNGSVRWVGSDLPLNDALLTPTTGDIVSNSGTPVIWNGSVWNNLSNWTTSGSDLYYTTGKVGIGTTTPGGLLSVQGNTNDLFTLATSTANPVGGVDKDGHRFTSGPAPIISSCGTGTGTVVGDDMTGNITTATAATACTATFAKVWTNTPVCIVTDDSLVGFAAVTSISTTAVTFGISSALTAGHLYYSCSMHR